MENKVVLVTGSSRGIGKATIIEFAKKGYDVVINYIDSKKEAKLKFIKENEFEYNNKEDAYNLKTYIEEQYNVNALVVETDVSNEEEVKNCLNTIMNNFGRIDVLVNCAGIVFDRNIYDANIPEFENTYLAF